MLVRPTIVREDGRTQKEMVSNVDSEQSAPTVELVDISKTYPGVIANDSIDISLRPGEVHILLGENGAGKSTLIGILSGMITPDAGQILVAGIPVSIKSPKDALELGIGTVYQHSLLVPTLSVLDNMMLGSADWFILDRASARLRLAELSQLLDIEIDGDTTVGDLALGQRQQVEIVRALWRGEQALILDEPTSMLTPKGIRALGRVVARLADQGLAVVFITHKLDEALEFGDRVSVLRRGRKVGELSPAELTAGNPAELKSQIIELIFGTTSNPQNPTAQHSSHSPIRDKVSFQLKNVTIAGTGPHPLLNAISLEVHEGEVFGIAGIDGNGQRELAEVIAGQRQLEEGEILLDNVPIHRLSVAARQDLGIRYVTDDRHGEGTVGDLSIALNTVLKRIGHRPFWRRGRVRNASIELFANNLISAHDVRTPNEHVPIKNLSGGNMQKVVVGRELAMGPRVVVYNKPTYGLDVKTANAVLGHIKAQADQGTTAILISTELDELISTCDRIGVMHQGKMTGILQSRPGIETELGELMTGATFS